MKKTFGILHLAGLAWIGYCAIGSYQSWSIEPLIREAPIVVWTWFTFESVKRHGRLSFQPALFGLTAALLLYFGFRYWGDMQPLVTKTNEFPVLDLFGLQLRVLGIAFGIPSAKILYEVAFFYFLFPTLALMTLGALAIDALRNKMEKHRSQLSS